MQNIDMKRDGDKLVITIDLSQDHRHEWVYGGLALAYTWVIYDERSFLTPWYTLLFAACMGLYVTLRKFQPAWIPEGARDE